MHKIILKVSLLIIVCLILNDTILKAQQRTQSTTQLLQGFLQNPALVGVENYSEVRLSYNKQWQGFEGAPTATAIGYSTSLGKDSLQNRFQLKTLPLRGRYNANEDNGNSVATITYKKKFGLGASLSSYGDDVFKNNEANLLGAIHFPIKKNYWSWGIGLGVSQNQVNTSSIKLISQNDETFTKLAGSKLLPSIQIGSMFYTNEFFIGFNSSSIVDSLNNFSGKSHFGMSTTSYITGGLRFKSKQGVSFSPVATFRHISNMPSTVDMCMMLDYLDVLKFGFMYRTNGDIGGIIGLVAYHRYSIHYTYDVSASSLRSLYSNTHNLLICFRLGKSKYADCKPKNYW